MKPKWCIIMSEAVLWVWLTLCICVRNVSRVCSWLSSTWAMLMQRYTTWHSHTTQSTHDALGTDGRHFETVSSSSVWLPWNKAWWYNHSWVQGGDRGLIIDRLSEGFTSHSTFTSTRMPARPAIRAMRFACVNLGCLANLLTGLYILPSVISFV